MVAPHPSVPCPQLAHLTSRVSASSDTASVGQDDEEETKFGNGDGLSGGKRSTWWCVFGAVFPTSDLAGSPGIEPPTVLLWMCWCPDDAGVNASEHSSVDSYDSVGSCVRDFELDFPGENSAAGVGFVRVACG